MYIRGDTGHLVVEYYEITVTKKPQGHVRYQYVAEIECHLFVCLFYISV